MYQSQQEIPAQYVDLFEEKDGAFVLSKIEGIRTEVDVENVKKALNKERELREGLVKKYKVLGEEDPETILTKLNRIKELEAISGGKLDEETIGKIVESRIAQKTSPLEMQLKEISEKASVLEQENNSLKEVLTTKERSSVIRDVANESKCHSTAISDIEMAASVMFEKSEGKWVTKNNIDGVLPGLSPKEWIKEMQRVRPHWWPESLGGGSRGGNSNFGNANNPFSKENWNLTEQLKLRRDNPTMASHLEKISGNAFGQLKNK